jgi:HAD superfamily hydrolase (TIGR01509 family)
MSVQLVIFDCDGVLFHSEAANIGFYNAVFEAAGEAQLGDADEAACHALASAQLFEKYFGHRPERLARVREAAQATDYAPFFPLMKPRERLFDVLAELGKKYKLALATNRGKTVHQVLEFFELTRFFDLAVGVYDVDRPKPHPDMLLKCLEHFGVAADEAVYVGDQETDRQSAHSAGVSFIAIGDAVVNPAYHVDELCDLDPILSAL